MNTIQQWVEAIKHEDGHRLSIGSLKTLKLIEQEYERKLQKERGQKADTCEACGSILLEYLQNQKSIAIELQAPEGEIELLEHIIKKVNEILIERSE